MSRDIWYHAKKKQNSKTAIQHWLKFLQLSSVAAGNTLANRSHSLGSLRAIAVMGNELDGHAEVDRRRCCYCRVY